MEQPETHPDYWNAIMLYVIQAKNHLENK
jgi:hypothetical protein